MKSFNKTTTLFGIALAFTIAVGSAYTFFFVAMKNKTEATATLSASSGELSGKESRVLSAGATLKSESVRVEKLSSYFIKESEIVMFTRKIEALGPQSGTTLTIESLDRGLTEKTVPYLNLRIKAMGKFADVMRLLTFLENFPGKFEWKTIRLVRDDSAKQQTGAHAPKSDNTTEWSAEVFLTVLNFVKE
ncbi:MAG: hypothetical protein HZB12_03765 [Candidatus Yonathbacteria bacterium]|nr:hypothetical protein [Candidatus Yonathbacteria bacterium]